MPLLFVTKVPVPPVSCVVQSSPSVKLLDAENFMGVDPVTAAYALPLRL